MCASQVERQRQRGHGASAEAGGKKPEIRADTRVNGGWANASSRRLLDEIHQLGDLDVPIP